MPGWRSSIVFFSLVGATGCSSLKEGLDLDSKFATKEYVVDRLWVRAPKAAQRNEEFRRSHRMEPVVLEDMVLHGNAYSGLMAFDRKSGATLWERKIRDGVEGGAVVSGDFVYFGGGDGKFYALHVQTGEKVWEFSLGAQVLATPSVLGNSVYFLSGNNTLYSLDTKTGKQNWLYRRAQTTNLTVRGGSQPVFRRGIIYIGMSDGYLVAVDARDGGLIWERPLLDRGRFIDVDATPVLSDGKIYVASYDGALFCLDAKDGQVVWTLDKGGATGVILQGASLYFSTSQGEVLSLDKTSGKVQWSFQVPNGIGTLPRYHRGLIVFGESNGPLRFLSAQSGTPVTLFDTGRGISGPPFVSQKGEIFFSSNEGYLYGLKVSRRTRERSWIQ